MFSLAHLSDPHLPLPPGAAPFLALTGKQVLSRLAWQRKRRHITDPSVLDALSLDLAQHAPDHIAITGDLINLGRPLEVAAAGGWLARLGPAHKISVVPGNHDRLSPAADLSPWAIWMGDERMASPTFPFLRRRREVAIIGLCSGLPTPVFMASGRLGAAQLERTASLLEQAGRDNLFRIVLIHHPPVILDGGRRKALRDHAALGAILRRYGAELVLHGHHHCTWLATLEGPDGPLPILGVPSASAVRARPEPAGWNLHRIARHGAAWRLTTVARRYDISAKRFFQAGEWSMDVGVNRSA